METLISSISQSAPHHGISLSGGGGGGGLYSYPRAPTLRKLDTPLCDYDGTPLAITSTSSSHPSAASVYFHPNYLHQTTPAIASLSISNSSHPSLSHQRKSSTSRLIIDEALAHQLGVSCQSQSSNLDHQHSQSSAHHHHHHIDHHSTSDESLPPSINLPILNRDRTGLYQSNQLPTRSASFSGTSSSTQPTVPTPQIQRSNLNQKSIKLPASLPSEPTSLSNSARSTSIDSRPPHPSSSSPSLLRRPSEPSHYPSHAQASSHLDHTHSSQPLRFVPSPSNRRMGFSSIASREVVPSQSSSNTNPPLPGSSSSSASSCHSSDPLLQVSVIALESIWPHYTTAQPSPRSNSTKSPSPDSLLYFIKEVLRRSRTNPNTLKIGLFYLHQSRRSIRDRLALSDHARTSYDHHRLCEDSGRVGPDDLENFINAMKDPVLSGRKMFLASLMCASKYLQDRNFSNRAWAKISGLPIQEVNSNERVFLALVDYRLHVDLPAFDVWSIRLQKLMDEKVPGPHRHSIGDSSPIHTDPQAYRTPDRAGSQRSSHLHSNQSSTPTRTTRPPMTEPSIKHQSATTSSRSTDCPSSAPQPRMASAPSRGQTVPIVSRPSTNGTLLSRALENGTSAAAAATHTPIRQHTTPHISRPTNYSGKLSSATSSITRPSNKSNLDSSAPYPASPLEHTRDHTLGLSKSQIQLMSVDHFPRRRSSPNLDDRPTIITAAEVAQAERELLEKIARERCLLEKQSHVTESSFLASQHPDYNQLPGQRRWRDEEKKLQLRKLIEQKRSQATRTAWTASSADDDRNPTGELGLRDRQCEEPIAHDDGRFQPTGEETEEHDRNTEANVLDQGSSHHINHDRPRFVRRPSSGTTRPLSRSHGRTSAFDSLNTSNSQEPRPGQSSSHPTDLYSYTPHYPSDPVGSIQRRRPPSSCGMQDQQALAGSSASARGSSFDHHHSSFTSVGNAAARLASSAVARGDHHHHPHLINPRLMGARHIY